VNQPELSIILVNYNDRAHLPACLSSLEQAIKHLDAEVILVDNHSEDGSPELAKSAFPWVRLIMNDQNAGYPKANNIGLQSSYGRFVLFLNTDTVVPEDALFALLAEIKARPDVGAIGPALVDENSRHQVSFGKSVSFFAEIRQKLLLNPYYRMALRFSRRSREVGWLSGACLLLRKDAVEASGPFDERFFLYFEDIDLCRRIENKGFRLIFFPAARIIHIGGAITSARKWRSRLEYRRSQLLFYRKYNSRLSLYFLGFYLRLNALFLSLSKSRQAEEKALFQDELRRLLRSQDH
jgi:hypothetical protein